MFSAAEKVLPRQEICLSFGELRISWVVMEQWSSCPACSLLDMLTELFKSYISLFSE